MFSQEEILPEMPKLHKFALRLTRNKSDADDLLQETVLRVFEKNSYFLEGSNLFSWSSRIMFNIFATRYRRKKRYETQYDSTEYINNVSVDPSQDGCVDLSIVAESMRRLSAEHRSILLLVGVKGFTYAEVSKLMNIPVGTVRSRLSRARYQLQKTLLKARPHGLEEKVQEKMDEPSQSLSIRAPTRASFSSFCT